MDDTSCSTPVYLPPPSYLSRPSLSTRPTANLQVAAGIISLLNDYLLSKGQPALGLLNPWLYGYGFEALFDIATGSDPGCNTVGSSAIDGWDLVCSTGLVTCSLSTLDDRGLRRSRGLGTLDFGAMQEIFDHWVVRTYIFQNPTN